MRLLVALCALLAILAAPTAGAAQYPSAAAPREAGASYPSATHSWVVLPAAMASDFTLVHVPPRLSTSPTSPGTADGVFRSSVRLAAPAVALAAHGNTVYLIAEPRAQEGGLSGDTPGRPARRSVFSLAVERFADSQLWVDVPAGRMQVLPGLPIEGAIQGFAADRYGPIAVLREAVRSRLFALRSNAWVEVNVPAEFSRSGDSAVVVELASDEDGLHLAVVDGDRLIVHSRASLEGDAGESGSWSRKEFSLAAEQRPTGTDTFRRVAGRWYAFQRGLDKDVRVWAIAEASPTQIAVVPDVPETYAVVVNEGLERAIVVSIAPRAQADGSASGGDRFSPEARRAVEISLISGTVLYDGPLKPVAAMGGTEFRAIAAVLFFAMAVVLVLALRGDDVTAVHLPEGWSLAEPGRRLLASTLDLLLLVLVLPRVTGHSVLSVLGPQGWLDGSVWEVLLVTALAGVALSSVCESLFGRTLGKFVTDCRVVSVGGTDTEGDEPAKIAIWQALMRNAVKWLLPPVALLGLFDDASRHRGDVLARTAVVIRTEDDPETDDAP